MGWKGQMGQGGQVRRPCVGFQLGGAYAFLLHMPTHDDAVGSRLLATWNRCKGLPGSAMLFNLVIRNMIPYTGALGCRVEELKPGYARVVLRERRAIRNHLRSVHAVAVTNLGEFTGGIALTTALPDTVRAIVRSLSTEYVKKARGTLTAECRVEIPTVSAETEHSVQTVIRDGVGDEVARVTAVWNLRPSVPA